MTSSTSLAHYTGGRGGLFLALLLADVVAIAAALKALLDLAA